MEKGNAVLLSESIPAEEYYLKRFCGDIGTVKDIDGEDVLVDWYGAQAWVKKSYLDITKHKSKINKPDDTFSSYVPHLTFSDRIDRWSSNFTELSYTDLIGDSITSSMPSEVRNIPISTATSTPAAPRYVRPPYARRERSYHVGESDSNHRMGARSGGIPAPQSLTVIRRRGER